MKPQRLQRKRTKGYRLPEGTICVTRGTKWGNPYKPGSTQWCPGQGRILVRDKEHAVELYRRNVCDPVAGAIFRQTVRQELRGKNLACYCKPGAVCHADVLLELANADSP